MLYFLAKYKFPGVRNAVAHDMRREGGNPPALGKEGIRNRNSKLTLSIFVLIKLTKP